MGFVFYIALLHVPCIVHFEIHKQEAQMTFKHTTHSSFTDKQVCVLVSCPDLKITQNGAATVN